MELSDTEKIHIAFSEWMKNLIKGCNMSIKEANKTLYSRDVYIHLDVSYTECLDAFIDGDRSTMVDLRRGYIKVAIIKNGNVYKSGLSWTEATGALNM